MVMGSLRVRAQEISVYNLSTLQPIGGVMVYTTDGRIQTVTRPNGKAVVDGLRDQDTLILRHTSFHTEKLPGFLVRRLNYEITMVQRKIRLEETVVAADKIPESIKSITNKMSVLQADEIAFQNPSTSAELLSNSGEVYVQKSQMGGGSPVIRGFEANKVLLVMDGIRLNNAIYRSGHLQNVITIDHASVERTEVVFGPGSLIYGSDALGGVIHFFMRSPRPDPDAERDLTAHVNAFTRFGSANGEKTAHFDFELSGRRAGSWTSVTFSDFSDLRAGSHRDPRYPDFGKRNYYVAPAFGPSIDSVYVNPNPDVQLFSGYSQWNFIQKFLFKPQENLSYALNFYYATSSDIPRYDKLTDTKNGLPKYADWHYGPQRSLIGSFRMDYRPRFNAFDEASLLVAFQRLDEDRISRKFQSSWEIHREEDVSVLSLNLDLNKQIKPSGRLIYGAELYRNGVASTAFSFNILDSIRGPAATRYPDGGSELFGSALYVKYKHYFGDQWIVTGGARYSFILIKALFRDTMFYRFPFEEIFVGNGAMTGSAGIIWNPSSSWKATVTLSSGFKSPNIDDLGKVFEKNGIVVVPNDNLKPEYAYNAEATVSKAFDGIISVQFSGYYTRLVDAIVRHDFTLNGADTAWYDGDYYPVQANVNAGKAYIYGGSLVLTGDLGRSLSVRSNITYTRGWDVTHDTPMAHIPPLYGQGSLKYVRKKFVAEGFVRFNGWKHAENYSPSSEDNLDKATPDGTPPWYTLNLRTAYQVNEQISLQAGIENLLDRHYRPFSSGISAPGRLIYFTFRVAV